MPKHEPEVAPHITSRPNTEDATELACNIGKLISGSNSGTIMIALGMMKAYVQYKADQQYRERLHALFMLGCDNLDVT